MDVPSAAAVTTSNAPWISEQDLSDSIIQVVGALTGKSHVDASLKKVKMSEDVLYASLVYHELREKSAAAGRQFLDQLKGRFNRRDKLHNAQALARAVEEVAQGVGKKNGMTTESVKTVLRESFGHAQLDKTSVGLSRRARFTGLDSIEDRVNANKSATEKQVDRFHEKIKEKPLTTVSNAKSLRKEIDKIASSFVAKSSGSTTTTTPSGSSGSTSGTTTNAKGETENGGVKEKPTEPPTPFEIGIGSEVTVFKPKGETNGMPLFILNENEAEFTLGVDMYSPAGKLLANFKASGKGTDGRRYYRLDKKADGFEKNSYVQINFVDGTHRHYVIPNPREYFVV